MLSWPPALLAACDQMCAELFEGEIGWRAAIRCGIGEFAGEAVGAEEEEVAGLGFELEDVGGDAGLGSEGAGDDVAQRGAEGFGGVMRPMRTCSSTREWSRDICWRWPFGGGNSGCRRC